MACSRPTGIVSVISLVVFALFTPRTSHGVITNQCSGNPNYLESSPQEQELHIHSYYRAGQTCVWTIRNTECPSGVVVVQLGKLNHLHGSYDVVTVYDGISSGYPLIGTYSNSNYYHRHRTNNNGPYTSTGPFITVVLTFKNSHNERQFLLKYRSAQGTGTTSGSGQAGANVTSTCDNAVLLANQRPKFIQSPGYPKGYPNALDCTWMVLSEDPCGDDVLLITIHALSLENQYDYLVIYDGQSTDSPVLAKLTGEFESKIITALGHSVVIEFRTDDTAPGKGFLLSYVRTKAMPLFSASVSVSLTTEMAEVSATFVSGLPHRSVVWSKDGHVLHNDQKVTMTVTPAKVVDELEPDYTVDGYKATLRITQPASKDFGTYRISVRNPRGLSERVVVLDRALSVPVIHNYTVSSVNVSIMVTFSSLPDFQVEWYQSGHGSDVGNFVDIATDRVDSDVNIGENEADYMSVLTPRFPTEQAYGTYRLLIRNAKGTTEVYIHVDYPKTERPILMPTPSDVNITDKYITLSVTFDSNILYPETTWYHGDRRLNTSDRYRVDIAWKGIPSADWHTHGYPARQQPQEFGRVLTARGVSRSVPGQYPVIGGKRTKSHRTSTYTAVLIIQNTTVDDFGSYRVSIANKAGTAAQDFEVKKPNVFPYKICEQSDTVELVCNVTSCTPTFHPWVHSIGDDVIRTIAGKQDGSTNTLTIQSCMHADAGTYTCVVEKADGNLTFGRESDVSGQYNRVTLTVKAVPVITETRADVTNNTIILAVPFYSRPPYTRVEWKLNSNRVTETHNNTVTITTQEADVIVAMHGKMMRRSGHVTTLEVTGPRDEDFGKYKATIFNEMGEAELYIDVKNPEYVNPVVSSDVMRSFDGSAVSLNVTFSSYFSHTSVTWYHHGNEVTENHPHNKYIIQTDGSNVTSPTTVVRTLQAASTILTITCLSEEDYGIYDVIISNDMGKAVIPVALENPDNDVPEIVGDMTTRVDNTTAEITACFISIPHHFDVKWFKGDTEIDENWVDHHMHTEAPQTTPQGRNGDKVCVKTSLIITSLQDPDFGEYSVQVFNDVGMVDHSVILVREC